MPTCPRRYIGVSFVSCVIVAYSFVMLCGRQAASAERPLSRNVLGSVNATPLVGYRQGFQSPKANRWLTTPFEKCNVKIIVAEARNANRVGQQLYIC